MLNLLLENTGSSTTTTPTDNTGSIIIFIVLLVAIVGLFIWNSIQNKKKQKEAQNMVNNIKVGDRIKTIGGVCGFLVEINNDENTFVIETGTDDKKSYIKFDKAAIYQTGPANPSQPAKAEAPAEEPTAEVKDAE